MLNKYINIEDRLSILCREDRYREWRSLDDKRFCILCERTFTGRQVELQMRRGRFSLHCPTEDCNSTPRQWVHPGNPLVSEKAYQDWSLALGVPKKPAVARMAAQP